MAFSRYPISFTFSPGMGGKKGRRLSQTYVTLWSITDSDWPIGFLSHLRHTVDFCHRRILARLHHVHYVISGLNWHFNTMYVCMLKLSAHKSKLLLVGTSPICLSSSIKIFPSSWKHNASLFVINHYSNKKLSWFRSEGFSCHHPDNW